MSNVRTDEIGLIRRISLGSLLPAGMLDSRTSPGAGNAVRACEAIEKLIQASGDRIRQLSSYALLSRLPRHEITENIELSPDSPEELLPDFIRQYATALAPSWYEPLLAVLTDDEMEVFLKNYLHGHETWGHPEGVAALVRTMLESCTHAHVPVRIDPLQGQDRPVPETLWSRLGDAEQYARLGATFALGRRLVSRPESYDCFVGPVSVRTLGKLQDAGWAVETKPSEKLHMVVQCTEPFYFTTRIHILLETVGFVLAQAALGKDQLGDVGSETDEDVAALIGGGVRESVPVD